MRKLFYSEHVNAGTYSFLQVIEFQATMQNLPTSPPPHTQPFYGSLDLSRTTRVSLYQKKHSPTHICRGHQSVIPYLLPPSAMIHGTLPVQFTCLTVFLHSLSQSFLWPTSWPCTLHFILHKFLHQTVVFFLQYMPIALQPVLL